MELYQAYTDYQGMMELTESMFRYVAEKVCGTTLIKYGDLERRSNYELSILFRVTERRVRSLRHEAKLRYVSNVDTYVRTEFGRLLEQTQLVAEQEKILFVVEDAFLRDGIQARLKAMGNFADYSFNREILRVTYDAFAELLASMFSEAEVERFVDDINATVKAKHKLSFKQIIHAFLEGTAGGVGEQVINLSMLYVIGNAHRLPSLVASVTDIISRII